MWFRNVHYDRAEILGKKDGKAAAAGSFTHVFVDHKKPVSLYERLLGSSGD
jgi:hypothetical protein